MGHFLAKRFTHLAIADADTWIDDVPNYMNATLLPDDANAATEWSYLTGDDSDDEGFANSFA